MVFTQRSIYREELLAAIGSLGPAFAQLAKTMSDQKAKTMGDFTAEGAREAALAAMGHEADYLDAQRIKILTCRLRPGGLTRRSSEMRLCLPIASR